MGSGGTFRIGRMVAMKIQDKEPLDHCQVLYDGKRTPKELEKYLGLGFVVEVLALDVRPEFLEYLRERIRRHLRIEALEVISQVPLAGIIRVPDGCGHRVPDYFTGVEGPVAMIIARDQHAAGGVDGA